MRNLCSIALLTLLLIGCNATSNTAATTSSSKLYLAKAKYNHQKQETFFFGTVSDSMKAYEYDDVCFQMPTTSYLNECKSQRLPYDSYVGKKGYFTEREPFYDSQMYEVREAIIETGELVYLAYSDKYAFTGQYFITEKPRVKKNQFEPEPLVEGSEIMIVGKSDIFPDKLEVNSSPERSYTKEEIDAIRELVSIYPQNKLKIVKLITSLNLNFDSFEGRVLITENPYNNRDSLLSLNITIDSGVVYPFMRVKYEAEDWLFVERFSTSADGIKWESPKVEFKRDNGYGKIWEWFTSRVDNQKIKMLTDMATAENSVVRFYGQNYYSDYTMTSKQKEELSQLLQLLSLLKSER